MSIRPAKNKLVLQVASNQTLFKIDFKLRVDLPPVLPVTSPFFRDIHASLLIDMGCTPLLVAERLGHERVQTTMETYSHLYPNKQTEVAAQLDAIATKDDGYKKFG